MRLRLSQKLEHQSEDPEASLIDVFSGVGSDTWIRTRDPLINSQLLYR